jgi:pimeloyl-ACP methyl ester carboxylesterase
MHLHFEEKGKGIPIVLIHGFCENLEIWNGFSDELARYAKVIAIDLPGFGKSPLPPTPFSIDAIGSLVLELLRTKGIVSPILVGHSLGGYVALAMLAQDPEFSQKVVLFHSSFYADSDEKKENRDKVITFVKKNGVAPFIQTFVPTLFYKKDHPSVERVIELCNRTPAATLLAYTRAMRDRPDREDLIRNYPHHLLILCGDHDEVIPLAQSKQMAAASLKIKLFILPETGHMGMIESPEVALTAITKYID